MENETTDETVLLAGLDAAGLIDEVCPHSAEVEGWHVSMVDDRTVLAVGFGRVKSGRRIASGRVAWLFFTDGADAGWWQERRMAVGTMTRTVDVGGSLVSEGCVDPLDTFDDLVALLAWLRGGEPRTR